MVPVSAQGALVDEDEVGAAFNVGEIEPIPFIHDSESSEDAHGGPQDATTHPQVRYQEWLEPKRLKVKRSKGQRQQAKPAKKSKHTYDARREEKIELTAKMEHMQKQLDELKYRLLVEQGEAAKSNERVAASNVVLQEIVQHQHVELANMQAMIATHLQQNTEVLTPVHTIVHLGSDPAERHKKLMALRNKKLREGKRFLTARSRGLDPRAHHSQEERNNAPGEDFCVIHFEITPIHGVSAREVFEAFIDVAQNQEIVISEMFGCVAIRENSEAETRDVFQLRQATSTSQGTLVDSNSALFTEFEEDADGNCGVVVADFIDSDELYPYKPDERVRQDTTTVFMVRTFKYSDKRSQDPENNNAGQDKRETGEPATNEPIIVATRWTCSKIRRRNLNISSDVLRELQETTVSFGDTMKKCILQRLGNIGEIDRAAIH